jgi:glucose/arabinose dehydrogenase
MRHPIRALGVTAVVLVTAILAIRSGSGAASLRLDTIRLPAGFTISAFASDVAGARSMTLSPGGTLFVGTREAGVVYAIPDATRGATAGPARVVARGLFMPNGVAVRDGALYVAEVHRILRFDGIEARLGNPPEPAVVTDTLPRDRHHGWKFIAFGPDGELYVPVGAPCNVCEPARPEYAAILRMRPDGSGREVFARGVRNSVGFDWHPRTRELWFTDNGRDWLGDDRPPDELNHAPRAGLHFGFPYCFGRTIADPEFGVKRSCNEATPPALELGPHVAALGMRFYTGRMFPAEYRDQLFIAEHGSWNRSTPIGARVSLVRFANGRPATFEVFAEGWQDRQGVRWGRPADVLVMPDGALLVSDDGAGAIYRIAYAP